MPKHFDKWLTQQTTAFKGVLAMLLVTLIGCLDFFTGYELSFSIFYLFPVGFAGWYLGKLSGYLVSVLSAATWLALEYVSGREYSNLLIPFWNASVRLGFFIVVIALMTRLKALLAHQEVLAELDGLTGLYNARAFREKCDIHFQLSARNKHAVTLAFIDLDGFKGINDSLGHSTGDQVLKAVAEVLRQRLRASDVCARLGGDEFTVLLPETDLPGAQTFFKTLHTTLSKMAEKQGWPVGFSIGVAVFQTPQRNLDIAIKHADRLMYEVKHSGKNNIRFEVFGAS